MNNKYLFRVYHFDDKGNMKSPFVERGNPKGFGITEKAEGTQDDIGNVFGNLFHKGKLYQKAFPHYGFSAIGKIDPRFSIWFGEDAGDFDDEVLEAINKEISSRIPEEMKDKQDLKAYYKLGEKNDYDFLTNERYAPRDRVKRLTGNVWGANSFTLSPEYLDFDSDNAWDDLVEDIDIYDTHHIKNPLFGAEEGDKVVLVTAPEDKLISVDDVVKNGLTQQRDFPSEIVSSEVTPVRELNEYPDARSKYYALRNKGATGKEAFADSFKISPTDIVSDENMKSIYKDMCYFINGSRRKDNILKGIKELGQ
jgi:hypothetical protein